MQTLSEVPTPNSKIKANSAKTICSSASHRASQGWTLTGLIGKLFAYFSSANYLIIFASWQFFVVFFISSISIYFDITSINLYFPGGQIFRINKMSHDQARRKQNFSHRTLGKCCSLFANLLYKLGQYYCKYTYIHAWILQSLSTIPLDFFPSFFPS